MVTSRPYGGRKPALWPWLLATAALTLMAYHFGAQSVARNQPAAGVAGQPNQQQEQQQHTTQQQQQQRQQPATISAKYTPPAGVNFSMPIRLPEWATCLGPDCPYSNLRPATTDPTTLNIKSHAQLGDELWLYENMFWQQTGGFYLEMGGADGVSNSNSYWLSNAAGWKGMLIEADPNLYQKMTAARPEAICVNAAVCDDFKVVHHLLKSELGGIYEFMTEGFKRAWSIQVDDVNKLPAIPCVPLNFILERFGITTIDIWSLDVEEAELMVVKGFDFSKVYIKTMVVEANGHDPAKDQAVTDHLAANGIKLLKRNSWNNLYINERLVGHENKKPS